MIENMPRRIKGVIKAKGVLNLMYLYEIIGSKTISMNDYFRIFILLLDIIGIT